MTPSRSFLLVAASLLAVLLTGCARLSSPEGWAAPTIDDDLISYAFGDDNRVAAIDITTGERVWTFPDEANAAHEEIDLEAVYADPIVAGDTVVIASFEKGIYGLGRATGALTWSITERIDGDIVGTPALIDDILYVPTTHGRLYAVTLDGSPAPGWPEDGVDAGDPIWAPAIPVGDTVVVATMRGHVSAYSANDGSLAWESDPADGAIADLGLLDGEVLFVPSFDRHVYLLDASDGTVRNPDGFSTKGWVWQRPASAENVAYFGDLEGFVYALDIETGRSAWPEPHRAPSRIKATPALAGEFLVVIDRKPAATILDAATGEARAALPIAQVDGTVRAPLISDGNIAYFLTTRGDLWSLDPESRDVTQVGGPG